MLTRLRVKGFKNLRDIDVKFSPFTCVAGPNGAGKSNLFDAIMFLSDLASMPIIRAASKARGTNGRAAEFDSLFFRGDGALDKVMVLVVEMVVPISVLDDFDREARPTATLLQYSLTLRLNGKNSESASKEPIFIEREELKALSSSDALRHLEFGPPKALVKRFVFGPAKRTRPFIEMGEGEDPVIVLAGDRGGKGGRAPKVPARKSPQTVLSGVNSVSHPTALAARREMQSWRLLQLEPTALRKPDEYRAEARVSVTGEHLPNALHRLGSGVEVANRLAALVPDVRSVEVDSDNQRELRTLMVETRGRQRFSASSLSDGTLRFLALAVLATDPSATGLLCMEEPENGIHPQRIPEMLRLVRSLSDANFDDFDWEERSALRQVIINTHSPLVVAELPDDELLMAETVRYQSAAEVRFNWLDSTWRMRAAPDAGRGITRGEMHSYLSGRSSLDFATTKRTVRQRVDETADLFQSK